jgi:hypothetical protein
MTMPSPAPWLDAVLIGWFVLTAISVAYVAWDAFTRNPELRVMKWGWLLVTLYGGPIMAAAAITTALGLPMWQDVIAEYVFGFAFGLLIFQALFMRDMAGGSYWGALRMSFIPEWLSMNAVMAGMIPTMVVLMSRDMAAMHANSLRFWGVMSLATLVGFAVAYPINLWLVGVRLKHGMGTVRVLGHGGREVAADRQSATPMPDMKHDAMAGMSGMGTGPRVTGPQIVAMTALTLLMLGAGIIVATLFGRWAM